MERIPIGIEPKNIWISRRINELKEAIKRYAESFIPIPIEWINEYNEHIKNKKS